MLQIEVKAGTKTRNITRKNGEPMAISSVTGLVRIGMEVRQVELELQRGEVPPAPGHYTWVPTFQVNQYGRIELARAYDLRPAQQASKAA